MGGQSKVYSLAEVSKHNDRKDCWILINGKVYDVTKFLDDHPGGDEALLSATGKDASDSFEDVGHTNTAKAMMGEFYVGDIDASTIPTKTKNTSTQPHNQGKTPDFILRLLQVLVTLVMLGTAFGVRFYTKETTA